MHKIDAARNPGDIVEVETEAEASVLGRHFIFRILVARVSWFGIDDRLVVWDQREDTGSTCRFWTII